jgi:RND family efflux transporter MFP subunit
MIQKILKIAIQYKIIVTIIIVIAVFGGYFGYTKTFNKKGAILYATTQVQKGTLIISVSGSGQVSTSNQIDIKPKIAGEVVYLGVKNGQEVKADSLLVQLDSKEAEKAVRDAEVNLESAKLSLEKLKKPADTLSLLQAENSLNQAKESKQKAEDDLKKAYEDGFNTVSNAFLDLPGIMARLEDMMFDNTIDPRSNSGNNLSWYANQTDYQTGAKEKAILYMNDVAKAYNNARKIYEKNFDDYKATSRTAKGEVIEALIIETYETAKIIADTIKAFDNYIDFVQDDMEKRDLNIPSMVLTHQTNISADTNKINSHLLNLLAIKSKIEDSKKAIINAERLIAEKTEYLEKLKAGADTLDIQAAELNVKQRENALLDAKEKLEDYFVRAPFDGIIAKVNVKKGDFLSLNNILATLISYEKIAEISLNEIDVAKLKIGQEAILTFDAFPELEMRGKVVEISTIGTEEQGVVSYDVKISLEKENAEIKPGMTVNAKIFVDKRENVLLVPNSAIKSDRRGQYVEIVKNYNLEKKEFLTPLEIPQDLIEKRYIKTGISNDEFTEVLDGLKESEVIIVRTLSQQTFKNQQQTNPFLPRLPFGQQRRQ